MIADRLFQLRSSPPQPWQLLRRHRWWLALVCGGLGVLIESVEHHLAFEVNIVEILGYGLVLPVVVWAGFTLLARALENNARTTQTHSRYQQWRDRLERCHDWAELIQLVIQLPGELLPLTRVALYTYDHSAARFELAAERFSSGLKNSNGLSNFHCRACLLTPQPHFRSGLKEYCQPLTYQKLLIGTLNLHFRSDAVFNHDQLVFLASVAPSIALALALAIAQPQRLTQVRAETRREEQRHLAYELHESLAQHVAYLHLNLDRIATDTATLPPDVLQQELVILREVAGDAYQQVRDQLALLRPRAGMDLTQSLRQYIRLFAKRSRIRVSLISHGTQSQLPASLHSHVFSLIRECLNNVQRHAQAYEAQIVLDWADDQLVVSVKDDGIGFDPAIAPGDGHHGLVMLRERAEALHGTLHIHSSPNRGAHLIFHLPLREAALVAEHLRSV